MIARCFPAVLVAAVLVSAACTDTRLPTSSVDDSTFVRTMVDLQRLGEDTTIDSLMRDSSRHVILRRHGLTADELVQAARALAYDPDHAERVWSAITTAGMRGARAGAARRTTPNANLHLGTPPVSKP
jgi:hypothetical protein